MNVLHIAAWYPNTWLPHEAPFVKRHVECLAPQAHNQVWHIDLRTGERWRSTRKSPVADRTWLVATPLRIWFVIEWLATLMIIWSWWTRDRREPVDVVNFHIAYPNCTRIRLLRVLMRRPMVITEHYSAYRIGYNVKSNGAKRIRRIFHADVPVIAVSKALARDITAFAGPPAPIIHTVDNAVETSLFRPDPNVIHEEGRFFAIAGWRSPKRPDLLLEALARVRAEGRNARLRMAGTGPMDAEVREMIDRLGLSAHVDLLGQLSPAEVADEMRRAHALVHAADYETYSAVCAEALCSGTPVIASAVGGITEYMDATRGALVMNATAEAWADVWIGAWDHCLGIDRVALSAGMIARAGTEAVGERYAAVLRSLLPGSPNG
ncbi:MAG: glycosyltransferase [Flavobacteriales bacterium]|nr:glycosyltransferase [Flavobacteriales bacterium]